jgi:hypothetical protein
MLDLTIAVASLREQIEPDPGSEVDPSGIRERLSTVTQRFRAHQAREADLVYEATGLGLQEPLDLGAVSELGIRRLPPHVPPGRRALPLDGHSPHA